MKRWWECFDKLQQEKEEAAESKHAPCQRAWPRCGDQSIDRGKNKVRRSGKNPSKKSSYRSPLNSRNIRQEGGVMQTHDRLFVVSCTLRAFRDIFQIDDHIKEQTWQRFLNLTPTVQTLSRTECGIITFTTTRRHIPVWHLEYNQRLFHGNYPALQDRQNRNVACAAERNIVLDNYCWRSCDQACDMLGHEKLIFQ